MTRYQKLLVRKKLKEQREDGVITAHQYLHAIDVLETTKHWGAFAPKHKQ